MSGLLDRLDLFNPSMVNEWDAHLTRINRMYSDARASAPQSSPAHCCPVSTSIAQNKFFGYDKVDDLAELTTSVGSGQCAALIQTYVKGIGLARTWVPGPRVQDLNATSIPRGTVIATFWNGKYPNQSSGNHVAFYLSHNSKGIQVVEQWSGVSPKEAKGKRSADGIRFKGITVPTDQSGAKPNMTNTAEYYCVVLDKR